jgi:hypothetical protein
MGSNEDTFYIKVLALNNIYNFVVLSFYVLAKLPVYYIGTHVLHDPI